jgi:hypothetical protein
MSETQVEVGSRRVVEQAPARTHKRRHERQDAQAVVQIYWRDESGLPCESVAVIKNISARGFGIQTDSSFPVGRSITVRTPKRSLECEVRHVQERRYSFRIGLEIRSSSDGSSLERSLRSLASALDGPVPASDQPA